MPRRVLLSYNRKNRDACDAAPAVRVLIERHGELVGEIGSREEGPLSEAHREIDLVVALGGDGTLLAQARRLAGMDVPLLGVNLGRLGFMAEFDLPALERDAPILFGDGELPTNSLSMLGASVIAKDTGAVRFEGLALNEAAITAGFPFRMIELGLRIDGEKGPVVSGDGLIVSTPTGSTAYNVSAGGPIVAPGVDALTITPIAPHTLSFRPIVAPGNCTVEIVTRQLNEGTPQGGTTLVLDGQVQHPLEPGDRIRVAGNARRVRFVRNTSASFWATVIEKLHWGVQPRMRGS